MNLSFMNFFGLLNKKNHTIMLGILLLLIVLSSADLALDGFPHLSTPHLSIHLGLILLYIAIVLALFKIKPKDSQPNLSLNQTETQNQTETETQDTRLITADSDAHEETIVPPVSLADKMEQAFIEWQLTTAEKKVATLLILGHSLKEIAENCHRGEGTVRQHATIIYKKAQLSGRAKLTAYFLQDFIDTEKLQLASQPPASSTNPSNVQLD